MISLEMAPRAHETQPLLANASQPKQKTGIWLLLIASLSAISVAGLYFFILSLVDSNRHYDHPFKYSGLCQALRPNHPSSALHPSDSMCNELEKFDFTTHNSSLITAKECKEGLEKICDAYANYFILGFSSLIIAVFAGAIACCIGPRACPVTPATRSAPTI